MFHIIGVFAVPLLALMAAYFGLLATLIALTRGGAARAPRPAVPPASPLSTEGNTPATG
jgi:hypothetical protein